MWSYMGYIWSIFAVLSQARQVAKSLVFSFSMWSIAVYSVGLGSFALSFYHRANQVGMCAANSFVVWTSSVLFVGDEFGDLFVMEFRFLVCGVNKCNVSWQAWIQVLLQCLGFGWLYTHSVCGGRFVCIWTRICEADEIVQSGKWGFRVAWVLLSKPIWNRARFYCCVRQAILFVMWTSWVLFVKRELRFSIV